MSKHTPGPLTVHDCPVDGVYITTAENVWVASTSGEVATPQDVPNAILFAAAPDMLAALMALMKCPDTNLDELDPITIEAIELADAAIAKATAE